jgi:hypothetical protein
MELTKTQSLQLIHRRLDKLSNSIASLDDVNVKEYIEMHLTKLRAVESDLIADDSNKTSELVQHRATIELLTGVN